jgi:hypothetical protein
MKEGTTMDARLQLTRPTHDRYRETRVPARDARLTLSGAVVGEAPTFVMASDVRAYATRIAGAWDMFIANDYAPEFFNGKQHTPQQRLVMQQTKADELEFRAYRVKIGSFDLGGPSPSEAWQALIVFESKLRADRDRWRATFGAVASKDPPPLESDGGVKQPTPIADAAKAAAAGASDLVKVAAVAAVAIVVAVGIGR